MRVKTWNTRKHWALLWELVNGNAGSKRGRKKIFFKQKQNSGIQVHVCNEWMYCFQLSYHKDLLYLLSRLLFLEQTFKFPWVPHCSFQSNLLGLCARYLYSLFSSVCNIHSIRKNIWYLFLSVPCHSMNITLNCILVLVVLFCSWWLKQNYKPFSSHIIVLGEHSTI